MTEITLSRLMGAGWTSERKINIEVIEKVYKDKGIIMPDNVRSFFIEYGLLKISFDKTVLNERIEEVIEFDPTKAIGDNYDSDYFLEIFDEYDIAEKVYPIGVANRGNLMVLMSENNNFYRYTDGFLCRDGGSTDEMLDCVVGECKEPVFIE